MKNMSNILMRVLTGSILMGVQVFSYGPDAYVIKVATGSFEDNDYTIHADPNYDYDYNVTVDGDVYTSQKGDLTLSFPSVGGMMHTIIITGDFPVIKNTDTNPIEVVQWGTGKWQSMEDPFGSVSYLTVTASDNPDLSEVESMSHMFDSAQVLTFTHSINDWNVSNVTDMSYLFHGAKEFNQDIGDWDVSSVTNMQEMFRYAEKFNQDIGDWDVSKVNNMRSMFDKAHSISISNYDNMLMSWSYLNLQFNVEFDAGTSSYCQGETDRNYLVSPLAFNWTIIGDSKNCDFYIITPNEISVKSGETDILNVDANVDEGEGEGTTHHIIGGVDADKFIMNSDGSLQFNVAPDFNNPTDSNHDNIYRVQVLASNEAYISDVQTIKVKVLDDSKVIVVPVISYLLF